MKFFLAFSFLCFITNTSYCQITYVWSGGSTGDYQVAGNWTPTRTTPSTSDILSFTSNATVTNVLTQSISQLKLSSNAVVSLQAQSGASRTLTVGINNPSGDDIDIPSGCELILAQNASGTTTETFTIILTSTQAGATAKIAGTLTINKNTTTTFSNVFNVTNGTTTISGTVNNAGFLNGATATSLVFSDGATYNHLRDNGTFPPGGNFTGANINVTGYVTGTVSNFPSSIKSLTWNCVSQATNITATLSSSTLVSSSTSLAISGDVNILSTGSGAGAFVFNLSPVTVGGNMLISANGFDFSRVATGNTSNFTVTGNLTINNASTRNVNVLTTGGGTSNLTVNDFIQTGAGNFVLASATATGGTSNLIIKGNFNKAAGTGTFTTTSTAGITGNIKFGGTTTQILTALVQFSNKPNIEIDNAAGVTLNSNLTIPGNLKLTNGLLNSNAANLLTITSSASITGGSSSSFVNGPIAITTSSITAFNLPIGKGSKYRPIQITPDVSTATSFKLEYFNSSYSNVGNITTPLLYVSDNEYYDITRTAGTANITLVLPYEFSSGIVANTNQLAIARFDGSSWLAESSNPIVSGNTQSGTLTSQTPISNFGIFTIGSTNSATVLPFKLQSFVASLINQNIQLVWITSEEVNTQSFQIEKYLNGAWFKIAEIKAYGNSSTLRNYSYLDNTTLKENIYRLKVVDKNGVVAFSNVVTVNFNPSFNEFDKIRIYPLPAIGGKFTVQFNSSQHYPKNYSIINLQGQKVVSGLIKQPNQTINTHLNKGVYILSIGDVYQTKIIIN